MMWPSHQTARLRSELSVRLNGSQIEWRLGSVGHFAVRLTLGVFLSLLIGCSCSKPGDSKTRWTAVEQERSDRKGDR
jgi:hypothetical protein